MLIDNQQLIYLDELVKSVSFGLARAINEDDLIHISDNIYCDFFSELDEDDEKNELQDELLKFYEQPEQQLAHLLLLTKLLYWTVCFELACFNHDDYKFCYCKSNCSGSSHIMCECKSLSQQELIDRDKKARHLCDLYTRQLFKTLEFLRKEGEIKNITSLKISTGFIDDYTTTLNHLITSHDFEQAEASLLWWKDAVPDKALEEALVLLRYDYILSFADKV